MLDLSLLAPDSTTPSSDMINSSLYGNTSAPILARSRRPAILTYASPVVDAASTLSGLPWYIMGWKQESEILKVSMLEGVEFAKGWTNVPQSVKVVVEAEEKMQFYEVGVRIVAKLGGLRWLLYHHRILSFLLFTSMFWASSMISMSFAWFVISSYFAEATPATKTKSDTNGSVIKQEPSDSEAFDPYSFEDLSDTSRTFPSLGRQMPLHYSGRKDLKEGDDSVKLEEEDSVKSSRIQPLGAEADDEEECMSPETSGWRDSGIGTGLDEERFASVQRRRKASMDGV